MENLSMEDKMASPKVSCFIVYVATKYKVQRNTSDLRIDGHYRID